MVALRVVRSDRKRTIARGYDRATLLLGGYKYGDLAFQVGGAQMRQ
jgi:hypothetical protein